MYVYGPLHKRFPIYIHIIIYVNIRGYADFKKPYGLVSFEINYDTKMKSKVAVEFFV